MPQRSTDVEAAVRDWLGAKQAGHAAAIRAGLSAYDGALAIGAKAEEWSAGSVAFTDAHAGTAPLSAAIEEVDAHQEGAVGWQPCARSSDGTARLDTPAARPE